jgi:hypothetical protein
VFYLSSNFFLSFLQNTLKMSSDFKSNSHILVKFLGATPVQGSSSFRKPTAHFRGGRRGLPSSLAPAPEPGHRHQRRERRRKNGKCQSTPQAARFPGKGAE